MKYRLAQTGKHQKVYSEPIGISFESMRMKGNNPNLEKDKSCFVKSKWQWFGQVKEYSQKTSRDLCG